MKVKVVTLTTELQNKGLLKLKYSLDHYGWDYHIIHQDAQSGGHIFGTQMPLVYEYLKELKSNGEYTHVIYTDAWDTFALSNEEEFISKLPLDILFLGSAEKACFPHPELAIQFPNSKNEWKYPNGGGWFSNIKYFISMYDNCPAKGVNDQLWLHERFLHGIKNGDNIKLDTECKIFQTMGFEECGDFYYANECHRLINLKTKELPIFCHGNGRTNIDRVYALFNNINK